MKRNKAEYNKLKRGMPVLGLHISIYLNAKGGHLWWVGDSWGIIGDLYSYLVF